MKRTNRLMLIAGVALAGVSFVVVLAFGRFGQQQSTTASSDVPVVIAAVDVQLGTALTQAMLATENRPRVDATDTYQGPEEVVGQVVRRAVVKGQALTDEDFQSGVVVPELVSSIQPGMRAVAVQLSRVDSVGSLLQPGDYVDVLLSLDDPDGLNPVVFANPAGFQPDSDGNVIVPYTSLDEFMNNTTVKVVLQNVQVLAALPVGDESNDESADAALTDGVVAVLAATPQQVEVIRFAQLDGHVSVVLRAPTDSTATDVATSGMTLRQLVDEWGVLPPLPVTP